MRIALLPLLISSAFCIPAAMAQPPSDVAACRDIQDSLIRLRCFDDVSKPTQPKTAERSALPAPAKAEAPAFSRYAADPYRGPVQLPDFRGRDREHANFRTRILAGAKGGPNFAGHFAMVEIGCGSSCRFVPVVDVQTGRVITFPLGGEDYYSLDLKYRVDSKLVSAHWVADERCKREDIIWNGAAFTRGSIIDIGSSDACYRLND
jgi:hypothetical protein